MRDFRIIIHPDQGTALRILPFLTIGICLAKVTPHTTLAVLSFLILLFALLFIITTYSSLIDWTVKLKLSPYRSPIAFLGILALGYCCAFCSQSANPSDIPTGDHFLVEINALPKTTAKNITTYGLVKASLNQEDLDKKLLIKLPPTSTPPLPGDYLTLNATPRAIGPPRVPNGFNYKEYLQKMGVESQLYIRDSTQFQIADCPPARYLDRIRWKQTRLLQNVISSKNAALASALLLGSKNDLDKSQKETFQNAGAMHVLAVSGMHVGVVYLMLLTICRLSHRAVPSTVILLLPVIGVWGFACISGLGSPVLRASLVISLIEIGKRMRLSYLNLNLVAGSAVFLLLLKPEFLFQLGFNLSYAAVFGIITLFPKIENLFHFRISIFNKIWSMTALSIAAQLTTLPLILFFFQKFPLYSLISNLFLVPLTAILIPLGLIGLLLLNLSINFTLLFTLIDKLFSLTYHLLDRVAQLSNSILLIDNFHLEYLLSYYLVLISFIYYFSNDKIPSFKNLLLTLLTSAVLISFGFAFRTIDSATYLYQDYSKHLILESKNTNGTSIDTISQSLLFDIKPKNKILLNLSHENFQWPSMGCLNIDFVWINDPITWNDKKSLQFLDPAKVIMGTGMDYKSRRIVNQWCEENSIPLHNVYEDGFIELIEY